MAHRTATKSFQPCLSLASFSHDAPALIELPKSLFYSSAPSCFWAPSAPFAFRCPAHCNSGYVVIALPKYMPDPSPSSPGDKGTNILLFGLLQKLIIRYFPEPEDSQNLPEASRVERR